MLRSVGACCVGFSFGLLGSISAATVVATVGADTVAVAVGSIVCFVVVVVAVVVVIVGDGSCFCYFSTLLLLLLPLL